MLTRRRRLATRIGHHPAIARPGHRGELARLLIAACIAAVLIFAWGVASVRRRHANEPSASLAAATLPGITLDVAAGGGLIVTSLRSDGRGRRGVDVGDRLEAVDGRPVPSRTALAHVLAQDPARSVVLTLGRGTGTVDVALDRGHL